MILVPKSQEGNSLEAVSPDFVLQKDSVCNVVTRLHAMATNLNDVSEQMVGLRPQHRVHCFLLGQSQIRLLHEPDRIHRISACSSIIEQNRQCRLWDVQVLELVWSIQQLHSNQLINICSKHQP